MDHAAMKWLIRLKRNDAGVVYLEFLMVFFPIFMLFLGIIQASLMGGAKLVVQHAAYAAARSAIVVLDDDPKFYDMTPRGCLLSKKGGASSDGSTNKTLETLSALTGLLRTGRYQDQMSEKAKDRLSKIRSGGPRMSPVRMAAYARLLAIAPDMTKAMDQDNVEKAIGGVGVSRIAGGMLYNMGASALTFPSSPNGHEFKTAFEPGEMVHARLTYLYHCTVPLVSLLMCKSMLDLITNVPLGAYKELAKSMRSGEIDPRQYSAWKTKLKAEQKKLQAAQHPYNEVLLGAETPGVQLLAAKDAHFSILQATASLPYQGAEYRYKSEADEMGGALQCEGEP